MATQKKSLRSKASWAVLILIMGGLLLPPMTGGLQAQGTRNASAQTQILHTERVPPPEGATGSSPVPCPDTATGPFVRLQGWAFDPLCQPEPFHLPPGLSLTEYEEGEIGYYLIQFDGPILPEWKETIKAAGADLLDYVPDFTFIARMDPAAHARIAQMPMVRWTGIYQPGYRLSPELLPLVQASEAYLSAPVNIRVITFPLQDGATGQPQLQSFALQDAGLIQIGKNETGTILEAQVDASMVKELANVGNVRWIEPAPEWELHNEQAADVMATRNVWDTHGLYGEGQIVGVCDTGLDQGSPSPASLHDDFEDGSGNSRVIQIIDRVGDGGSDVNSGHGTHVSGSVLGNGSRSGSNPSAHDYPATSRVGMAPEAQLVFQAVENNSSRGLSGIPGDLGVLFGQARDAGVRVHTNSWGSTHAGQYTIDALNTDLFMWNNPEFTILFSAGNDGIDLNSGDGVVDGSNIGSPATAKNCITVGASENNRPAPFNSGAWGSYWPGDFPYAPIQSDPTADDPTGMAAFSSRGPTADGRTKPDITAPGTYVASTKSSAMSGQCGWGDIDAYYCYMGGTSMSTPLTAGATALVREFYTDQGLTPSAALIKATLVNGATDLYPGQYGTGGTQEQPTYRPNDVQGWGRVNLENSLFPSSPRTLDSFDFVQGLQTNEWDSFVYNMGATQPLQTTLAWTDYPGTPAAGGGLVNDLDLHVDAPDLTRYYPNNASQRGSTQMGMYDTDPYYVVTTNSSSEKFAVRFTPSSYPATVDKALIFAYSYRWQGSRWVSDYPIDYTLEILDDDGTGGAPGTRLYGPVTVRATAMAWFAVDIPDIQIASGSVYISYQPQKSAGRRLTQDSSQSSSPRSWHYDGSTWALWSGSGDLNIRAVMHEADSSTNYDRVNNLVGIDLAAPPSTGEYTIQVSAFNVANGPQPYALVAGGATSFVGASSFRIFGSGNVAARTLGRTGAELDFSSGPGGNVTATMQKSAPSHLPPSGATFLNINWNISSAMSGFSTRAVFHYDEADLPGSISETLIRPGAYRWNGASWDFVSGTLDTGANTVTVDGVTAFSDWALGAPSPTGIVLYDLAAWPDGPTIHVGWKTASELDVLGFNIHRSETPGGPYTQVNKDFITAHAPGSAAGGVYTWPDSLALPKITYYYRVEEIGASSSSFFHGPVSATIDSYFLFLPLLAK